MQILWECGDPIYRRLGAMLMIMELEFRLVPGKFEAMAEIIRREGRPTGRRPKDRPSPIRLCPAEVARSMAEPRPKHNATSRFAAARAAMKKINQSRRSSP